MKIKFKKINLFFYFYIIFSIIILTLILYKSEILYNSEIREYYKYYIILNIFFIIFNICCLYLNDQVKVYLNIIIITTFVCFYFFEFYVVFIKKKNKEIYYNSKGIKFDTRSTVQFYKDLKKKYKNVSIKVGGYNYLSEKKIDIFPLSGNANSLVVNCNENGYFSTYQSDRYGFNNNNAVWDAKQINYLVLGDSFTHGACVFNKDSIVGNLEKLTKSNILNLSMTGNGPLLQYATLREYGGNLNISKVLWFFSEGNDLQNLMLEIKDPNLSVYINNLFYSQNLKIKQKEIDQLNSLLINKIEKKEPNETMFIRFFKLDTTRKLLLNNNKTTYRAGSFNEFDKSTYSFLLSNFKQILNLTNEDIKKNNSELILIYMPEYGRYTKNYNFFHIKNDIKKITMDLRVDFIDIDNLVFKKNKDPLSLFPFENFFHYNEEGYKKVADAIYEHLNK